jgi:hypothetical protein
MNPRGGGEVKSFAARLLLGVAALVVVVSGCGVASKDCTQTPASSGGQATGTLAVNVPGNPSAHVNPVPPRYVPPAQIPDLEEACSQAADIAGADHLCQAKLEALLPLLTQLCPRHSHHVCLAIGFIAGQPGAVIKLINSLGGDVTCVKHEIALCVGVIVPKDTAQKAPQAAAPSVTPSTTVTPTVPPTGSPEPSISTPAPAGSPVGSPTDTPGTSQSSSPPADAAPADAAPAG